jgi:hypothetical protein
MAKWAAGITGVLLLYAMLNYTQSVMRSKRKVLYQCYQLWPLAATGIVLQLDISFSLYLCDQNTVSQALNRIAKD